MFSEVGNPFFLFGWTGMECSMFGRQGKPWPYMGRLTAHHIPMKPTGPLGTPETAWGVHGNQDYF